MEIICQRIPDRPTVLRHWKHASPRALVSLWRGTISSLWQTDRRCLREAGSATNGHKSPTQKDTAESSGIHAPLILVQNMILYCSARSLRCWWFCPTDALTDSTRPECRPGIGDQFCRKMHKIFGGRHVPPLICKAPFSAVWLPPLPTELPLFSTSCHSRFRSDAWTADRVVCEL